MFYKDFRFVFAGCFTRLLYGFCVFYKVFYKELKKVITRLYKAFTRCLHSFHKAFTECLKDFYKAFTCLFTVFFTRL
jgi:hypothetical protein